MFHQTKNREKPNTCAVSGSPDGVKLGFTVFLVTDDTPLDLKGIWKTQMLSQFRSTQPTKTLNTPIK